jgi:hypothetical protein
MKWMLFHSEKLAYFPKLLSSSVYEASLGKILVSAPTIHSRWLTLDDHPATYDEGSTP